MHIKSTKPAQNSILQLSNYYLQNLTNWDAAIQIFLNLYKLNSTIFHSYVTFHLTVAQYNTTIFVHRVFSPSHKLKIFVPWNKYTSEHILCDQKFFWLIEIKDIQKWIPQVFFCQKKHMIIFVHFWSIQLLIT